jgi:hypothetical protein
MSIQKRIIFGLCVAVCNLVGLTSNGDIISNPSTNATADVASMARADFEVACLNITRDVRQNRLRIYAVAQAAKPGNIKEDVFDIEVISDADLITLHKSAGDAYFQQYNHLVLEFAATQFANGKKELGLRLIKLLADAEPEMWLVSMGYPHLTIQTILEGLEKNSDNMKPFLRESIAHWTFILEQTGPKALLKTN